MASASVKMRLLRSGLGGKFQLKGGLIEQPMGYSFCDKSVVITLLAGTWGTSVVVCNTKQESVACTRVQGRFFKVRFTKP